MSIGVAAELGLHNPNMHFNEDGLQDSVDILIQMTLKNYVKIKNL